MKKMRIVTGWVMGAALCCALAAVPAKAQTTAAPSTTTASTGADIPDAELVTLTVHEAWVASGRNEDKFFDMVKRLAEMSAKHRSLTLPETAEAGAKAGALIKASAKRDNDQLLYAVVDHAVRKTAIAPATASTK